jgi:hypothetical protein
MKHVSTRLGLALLVGMIPAIVGAQTFVRLQPDTATGTISANGGSVVLTSVRVGAFGSVKIQTLDSYSGTWEVQCSANGTTYDADAELKMSAADGTTVVTSVTDAIGIWDVQNAGGCKAIKVIATAGFAATNTTLVISATQTGGAGGGGGGAGSSDTTEATQLLVLAAVDGLETAFGTDAVFGTAGTADADVLSIQGIASMTPVLTMPGTAATWGIHAEDSVHSSTQAGLQIFGVRQDSQADFGADGDYVPISINDAGEVRVAFSGAAGGTSLADDGDIAAGTTAATPISGFYQSSVTACTDGDACILGITAQRAAKVTLYSEAGAALTPVADMTVGTAFSTAGPGVLGSYKEFDGAALPTTANVNTEEEAAPFAVSLQGVQYVMVVNEDGSLERGTATTPMVVGDGSGALNTIVDSGTITAVTAITNALPAGTNAIGTVSQTATTLERYISAGATEDENEFKATAGVLVGISAYNNHASADAFLKCTNLTAANQAPGTSAIFYSMLIPFGGGFVDSEINATFSVALSCYIVLGEADTDVAEVAANDVVVNLRYR